MRQGYISNSEFEALRPSDFANDDKPREPHLPLNECRLIWSNVDQLALTDRNRGFTVRYGFWLSY
ncbi:hypothetical protein ACT3S9_05495 [Pseudoalteromonas sp. AOP31-A2-14]|uniref:hypothetical protein n=1 Tax=unclassified Pseudoalteromonas TaxID=194690 RepID=UPI00402B49B7